MKDLEEDLFTTEFVEDIIRLVGLPCNNIQELRGGLNGGNLLLRSAAREKKEKPLPIDYDGYITTSEKYVTAILTTIVLLKDDPPLDNISPTLISNIELALYSLANKVEKHKESMIEAKNREEKNAPIYQPFKRLQANTILAGEYLPRLYQSSFNSAWGISRPSGGGPPYGPGIRFIQESLRVMGLEMQPEAIYGAVRTMKQKIKMSEDAQALLPNWRE